MIVLGVIAVLIIIFVWQGYNSLVRLRNALQGAFAQVDVQLKRRYDLIPNLVETVKGYAAHEKEVFQQVTEARSKAAGAGDLEKRLEAEGELTSALGRLFAVAEAYPDLKANENFMSLQRELSETENKIESTRRTYNDRVMTYNKAKQQFPKNILAGLFNFSEEPYFTASQEEKKVVRVKF